MAPTIGAIYASAELSRLVKTRRLDMGLSQGAVARLCGLSRVIINQVENGSIKDLSLSRMARLLEALGPFMPFRLRDRRSRTVRTA